MRIVTKPDKPEEPYETGDFHNGDLYIERKPYRRGNRKDIYLCSCGVLIALPTANVQHSIVQQRIRRQDYVNVTTKFSLILDELYDKQRAGNDELTRQLRAAQTLNNQLVRDRDGAT